MRPKSLRNSWKTKPDWEVGPGPISCCRTRRCFIYPNIIILLHLMLRYGIPLSSTVYMPASLTSFPGLSVLPSLPSFDQPSFSVTLFSSHSKTMPSPIYQHVFDRSSPFNGDQPADSHQRNTGDVLLWKFLHN